MAGDADGDGPLSAGGGVVKTLITVTKTYQFDWDTRPPHEVAAIVADYLKGGLDDVNVEFLCDFMSCSITSEDVE